MLPLTLGSCSCVLATTLCKAKPECKVRIGLALYLHLCSCSPFFLVFASPAMSNLVEEMPLTLLDMAKPMTDDGNDTDVSQDHSAFSGFSRNDLPSHGERAKYSSFTTGDLPDLAMELERTEGLPPLERPFKAEDLATMSLPLTRTLSETKMLNNFQRHALICLVISCTILSHLVSSC